MRALVASLAALALGLSLSATARAEEPPADEATPRYPPTSVRWKLVAGGAAVTGAAYGVSALCASNWSDVPGSDALMVPVAGPWISLAQNDCAPDDPDCGFALYFRGFLLIVDGLVQAGGVGLIGEGLFMTTEADEPPQPPPVQGLRVRPVPVVTAHSTGLGLVGSF